MRSEGRGAILDDVRIGIVGKGGVGKTTAAALVARVYADDGRRVVAVDTDSNPNLGLSLGLTPDEAASVPVLPRSLVVAGAGEPERILAEYGRPTPAGPTLLSALAVTAAGAGCTCGGHATVRGLLAEALEGCADVTVVDMEAGLEHLSRSGGTLAYADALLVVTEPTRKSVLTAARTAALAAELGIPRTFLVGSKVRFPEDADLLAAAASETGATLAGVLPWDDAVLRADRAGTPVAVDPPPTLYAAVRELTAYLEGELVS